MDAWSNARKGGRSVGRTDAVLELQLGSLTLVRSLSFMWRNGARALLVLASRDSSGDTWEVSGSFSGSAAPESIDLNSTDTGMLGGVAAQRLRIFFNDTDVEDGLPLLGIFELTVRACEPARAEAVLPEAIEYSVSATPVVRSVTPKRGSTAGGTDVLINVTTLPHDVTVANLSVLISGKGCDVTSVVHSAEASLVACTTGEHGRTSAETPGEGYVTLMVDGLGVCASMADAWYQYIDLWSRKTTWGGLE